MDLFILACAILGLLAAILCGHPEFLLLPQGKPRERGPTLEDQDGLLQPITWFDTTSVRAIVHPSALIIQPFSSRASDLIVFALTRRNRFLRPAEDVIEPAPLGQQSLNEPQTKIHPSRLRVVDSPHALMAETFRLQVLQHR